MALIGTPKNIFTDMSLDTVHTGSVRIPSGSTRSNFRIAARGTEFPIVPELIFVFCLTLGQFQINWERNQSCLYFIPRCWLIENDISIYSNFSWKGCSIYSPFVQVSILQEYNSRTSGQAFVTSHWEHAHRQSSRKFWHVKDPASF